MASWIVHLRVAEKLLSIIEGFDASYFAIGNIAPDSGIPDENWENFDPPAHVLHFQSADAIERKIDDLVFYRRFVAPHLGLDRVVAANRRYLAFLWGYFFHLITDNLWGLEIGRPTKTRFTSEFEVDKESMWRQVKRDWYGLDFAYVRAHPDCIFWRVFVRCAYTEDYLEFLPMTAVQQRIEYIRAFYQRTDEDIEKRYIQRPGRYLSEQEMGRFVDATARRLHQVYALLSEADGSSDYSSALEFLSLEE